MKTFSIAKSRRIRSTPYTSRIEKQGVTAYTTYNHMLLPAAFGSLEDSYHHLKKSVQVWDVAGERQVEISGKDSAKLVQLMTCRDLSKSKEGRCYYCPIIDDKGGIINDPVVLKLGEERWWLSIADSDVLLYAKGLAIGKKFEVKIFEPDVNIIAVQGPKSFKLMEDVFGKEISELKFFKYNFFKFKNNKFLISRSGFSKQGGYEIHVENVKAGLELYDYFFEVGKKYNIKPGAPNHAERIEGGLLSYGNDMLISDNPFECGFEKLVHLNDNVEFIGKDSLKKILKNGIKRKLMGVKINSDTLNLTSVDLLNKKKQIIGNLRSAAFSPTFKKIVGIAMINKEYCKNNEIFNINLNDNLIDGEVCELPIV